MEILHYGKHQDNGSSPARRKNVKWYIPSALPLWIRNAHNNKMHNIFEWRNYKNKQTNKKTTTTCWRTEELICIPIKQHPMTGNTLFRLLPMKNRKKKIITTNRYCVKQALARDFGSYFTFLGNYEIKNNFCWRLTLYTNTYPVRGHQRCWSREIKWTGANKETFQVYITRGFQKGGGFFVAFYGFHQGKVFWSCYISYRLDCRASKHLMVL